MPSKRKLTTLFVPRSPKKLRQTVTMFDFYKLYNKHEVYTRNQYTKFLTAYYKSIRNLIIDNGYTYKFHVRLGEQKIVKYVPAYKKYPLLPNGEPNMVGMKIDWGKTNKLWKEKPELRTKGVFVYFENKHSDEYKYCLYWNKSKMNFKNNKLYTFKECRDFKIQLGKKILEGQDYLLK